MDKGAGYRTDATGAFYHSERLRVRARFCQARRAKGIPKTVFDLALHSLTACQEKQNKVAREGARAREYEDALQGLCDANLTYKIHRRTAPGLPISVYDDLSSFELYLVDVGLLRRLSLLAPSAFGESNRLFT